MSDTRLDEAIDRAVRDMMSVDPRPGLSRRVLARLDERRTPWLTLRRFAAATALVAAAVVTSLLLSRGPEPVQRQAETQQPLTPAAPQAGVNVPPQASPTTTPDGRGAPTAMAGVVRRPRVAHEYIPPFVSTVQVAPLASLDPIALDPVTPEAIESPEITVRPLAPLEPLRVDPLSSTPH